jgi:hypothetical protein
LGFTALLSICLLAIPFRSPNVSAQVDTPTPTATVDDAAVKRVGSPHNVRLSADVPVVKPVTVVVKNQSDHAQDVGLYLAIMPPGGPSNPGGCSPATVLNWVSYATVFSQTFLADVPAGGRVTLKANVLWVCADPSVVDGMNFTLMAIADFGNDDLASCDTLAKAFSGGCSAALADDDSFVDDNMTTRLLPNVVSLP